MFDLIRKNTLKLAALLTAAAMLAACTGGGNDTGTDGSGTENGTDTPVSDSGESVSAATPQGDWSYSQLAMGGGGYVSGVFSTSEENLYYARTDVGGAYRWDEKQGKWLSLSYRVTEENVGMMGIDGLAVDPDEPNKLYLIAGTSYFSSGRTWLLISEDYGDTFEEVEITDYVANSGNGMGRQNGERIAIDPVNNDILYLGGRTGGVIKSTDGGRTWERLQALSDLTQVNTANSNGICTIAIDPDSSDGSACQRIFAGVSKGGEDNVFVSEDGGASWAAAAGLPTDLFPQRMRLDGRGGLLIVYADSEGPWGGNGKGGIMRLNIADGTVDDISPASRSFGDVAISPDDPNKMVAVTENVWMQQPNGAFGDEFYVTTDGGASWDCVNDTMTFSVGEIDWIANAAIHWSGCLAMDPYNDGEIKVTSGNGIFACDNIWDAAPEFYFDSKGLEETVPMGLVTIPGGPIVTAVLDYDGFVNEDPFTYGSVHGSQAGAMYDIDAAYGNTDVWVKCGDGFWYTLDAGETWQKAKSAPTNGASGGVVGVNADGSRFFWAPEGSYGLYYTDDHGDTWEQAAGIYVTASVAGDPVNPDYVYGASGGSFYVSSDGGSTFTETYTSFASSMKIATVPGKEGAVYLPSIGLQMSTDHGQSFTRLENAAACLGVGVGKGVSDEQEALYIWGRPTSDDPMGIYWSTDGGASWQPVSTEYQFGGMGNGYFIKGDINVCGRCYISTVGLGVVVCDLAD